MAAGLDDEEAAGLVADSLVDAEMRGITSHGVTRCRIYTSRLRGGLVDAQARPAVVARFPAGGTVDSRNAMGHLGARAGVDLAADGAEESGAYVVGGRQLEPLRSARILRPIGRRDAASPS